MAHRSSTRLLAPGRPLGIAAVFALLLLLAPPALRAQDTGEPAAAETRSWDSDVPWSAGIGIHFNDDYFNARVNTLAPLLTSPDGSRLLSLDLSAGAFDEGAQNYSAGLVYRRYIEALASILGFNVFYDHVETAYGNGINALGLGLELKGPLDINVFYSFPEDDLKDTGRDLFGTPFAAGNSILLPTFNQQETGQQGGGIEVGRQLLPGKWVERWGELYLYALAYHYEDTPFGGGFSGAGARAEWRLNDLLTFDAAWYEDENFADGEWVFGFRCSIPLGGGKPLFGPAPTTTRGFSRSGGPLGGGFRRMGERVYRPHVVQTALSDESFEDSRTADTAVLGPGPNQPDAAPAFFVNDPANGAIGNGIGVGGTAMEDGSAENPFDSILEARAAANMYTAGIGGMPAYVYTQGGTPYSPGLVLSTQNIAFVGSGKPIFGFGAGPAPVVNGAFEFDGSGAIGGGASSSFQIEGYVINNNSILALGASAIALLNVAHAAIHDVDINNSLDAGDGIRFDSLVAYPTSLDLSWTTINQSAGSGAGLIVTTGPGASQQTVTTSMLTIDDAGDSGMGFYTGIHYLSAGPSTILGTNYRTTIEDVLADAVQIAHPVGAPPPGNSVRVDFDILKIDGAGGAGVSIRQPIEMADVDVTLHDTMIANTGEEGIAVTLRGSSQLDLNLWNTMIMNAGVGGAVGERSGIGLSISDTSRLGFTAMNLDIENTGEEGIEFDSTGMATSDIDIDGADISGAGTTDPLSGDGVNLTTTSNGRTFATFADLTVKDAAGTGLFVNVDGSDPGVLPGTGNRFVFDGLTVDNVGTSMMGFRQGVDLNVVDSAGFGFDPSRAFFEIANANISNTYGDGLNLEVIGDMSIGNLTADNLSINTTARGDGLVVNAGDVIDSATVITNITNLTIANVGVMAMAGDSVRGVELAAEGGSTINFMLGGVNRITNVAEEGFFVYAANDAVVDVTAANVTIDDTGEAGLRFEAFLDSSMIVADIDNFTIRNTSRFGIMGNFDDGLHTLRFDNIDIFAPPMLGVDITARGTSTVNIESLNDVDVFTPGRDAYTFVEEGGSTIDVNMGGLNATSSNDTTGFPNGFNRIEVLLDPVDGQMILDGVLVPIQDTP